MNETRREKNIEKKKKYFVYLKERGIYLRRFEERYDRSLEWIFVGSNLRDWS